MTDHQTRATDDDWNRKGDIAWKWIGAGTELRGSTGFKRDVQYDITAKSIEVFTEDYAEDFLQEIAKDAVDYFIYSHSMGVKSTTALQEKVVDSIKETIKHYPFTSAMLPSDHKYRLEFENTLEIDRLHLAHGINKFILIFNLEFIEKSQQ